MAELTRILRQIDQCFLLFRSGRWFVKVENDIIFLLYSGGTRCHGDFEGSSMRHLREAARAQNLRASQAL